MFLKNSGYTIETISIKGGLVITDGGIWVNTESLREKNSNSYDLLLFPGGEITAELLTNEELKNFLQEYGGLIAASCASSVILGSAGLIKEDYTTMPHLKEQYSEQFIRGNYQNTDVAVADRIITSRGFAHYEFMMEILRKLGILDSDPRIEKVALKLSKNQ